MYKIFKILLFVLILTIFFYYIPNKSNFPKKFIIPIIVALITKYSLGDLDKGYVYTISDIYYWGFILLVPYLIIVYLD